VSEILASKIASAEIFIESILLPEGLTATAVLKETKVVVATEAPSPAPTAVPSPFLSRIGDAHEPDNVVEKVPSPTGSPANGPEITTLASLIAALLVVIVLLLVIIVGIGVILCARMRATQQEVDCYRVYEDERGYGNAHVGVTESVQVVNGWTGTAESERRHHE
jgi:hypothetical protein